MGRRAAAGRALAYWTGPPAAGSRSCLPKWMPKRTPTPRRTKSPARQPPFIANKPRWGATIPALAAAARNTEMLPGQKQAGRRRSRPVVLRCGAARRAVGAGLRVPSGSWPPPPAVGVDRPADPSHPPLSRIARFCYTAGLPVQQALHDTPEPHLRRPVSPSRVRTIRADSGAPALCRRPMGEHSGILPSRQGVLRGR